MTNDDYDETYNNAPISLAIQNKDFSTIGELLNSRYVNINEETSWGNTPLMLAVKQQNLELVNLLLSKNGAKDSIDKEGPLLHTALTLAIENKNIAIVKTLTMHGASILQTRTIGKLKNETPCDMATRLYNDKECYEYEDIKNWLCLGPHAYSNNPMHINPGGSRKSKKNKSKKNKSKKNKSKKNKSKKNKSKKNKSKK
jgi:ankyrin repeat protein